MRENIVLVSLKLSNRLFTFLFASNIRASVAYLPTLLRARAAYVPTCLHANLSEACQVLIFTCQRTNKRANVPYGVPAFELGVSMSQLGLSVFQLVGPACQKACQCFKHSFFEMLLEISILYYHKKCYIILDIIVIHIKHMMHRA